MAAGWGVLRLSGRAADGTWAVQGGVVCAEMARTKDDVVIRYGLRRRGSRAAQKEDACN